MGKLLQVFLMGIFFLFFVASCSDDGDGPTESTEVNNDVSFNVSNESLVIEVSTDEGYNYESGESPLLFTSAPSVTINVTEISSGTATLILKRDDQVIYSDIVNSQGTTTADLEAAPTTGSFSLSNFKGKATVTVN